MLERIDTLLVVYFDVLHSEGGNPTTGSRTLAALLHWWPSLGCGIGATFPGARGPCAAGEIATSRDTPASALPRDVGGCRGPLRSIPGGARDRNAIRLSACFRPRELTSLLKQQLVTPQRYGGAHFAFGAIVLHPQEMLKKSKEGFWDASVIPNHAFLDWATPFFKML